MLCESAELRTVILGARPSLAAQGEQITSALVLRCALTVRRAFCCAVLAITTFTLTAALPS